MTAVMALLLMAGTSAFAQENKSVAPPRERPTTEQLARKATDRMTAQLKLTEKQAEQAYEATLERLQSVSAHRCEQDLLSSLPMLPEKFSDR